MTETRKIDELIWREDLYPRFEPIPSRIQQYAEVIDLLPPIEINQRNEIIDGYHRWTAHKKAELDTIEVTVTHTASDIELDRLMAKRNADFGIQLTQQEKQRKARQWFTNLNEDEQQIADDLKVPLRTVQRWLSRKKKDMKAEQKQDAFDLWLACWTYDEIGKKLGIGESTVIDWMNDEKSSENAKWHKLRIFPNHNLDPNWTPPIYNIWKQQNKSNEVSHPGNSETMILDNLLYMYTQPFDIVVDPFAGGGSTVDVCKKRLRRYWVSDRLPIVERRDIRQADITEGLPYLHKRWSEVALLYLDPPYWKQAKGKYSEDPEDLANMELGKFYDTLTTFIISCADRMPDSSRVALLMSSTQWPMEDKRMVDHVFDLVQQVTNDELDYEFRIVCPYESQQYNGNQVNWAKENKRTLVLNRELVVWKVCK
jgi:DNA-directed RNA polymerase specialized sigma24 family protein